MMAAVHHNMYWKRGEGMGSPVAKKTMAIQRLTGIAFSAIFLASFGGWFYASRYSRFVATHSFFLTSIWISVLLSIAVIVLLAWIKTQTSWSPQTTIQEPPGFKRFIALLFGPVLLTYLLWSNVGGTIPHFYASHFGEQSFIQSEVTKHRRGGRSHGYLQCKYYLKLNDSFNRVHVQFLNYCVSEKIYTQLQNHLTTVDLTIKSTDIGFVVEDIRSNNISLSLKP